MAFYIFIITLIVILLIIFSIVFLKYTKVRNITCKAIKSIEFLFANNKLKNENHI